MSEMNRKYDDMIYMSHHVSKKHPPMSLDNRAAQFAPFAALTGHKEAVQETARIIGSRKELDENQKTILDAKLQLILEQIDHRPNVSVTYFVPDEKKQGGQYVTVQGSVKKIKEYTHVIVLSDGQEIPIEDISDIDGELFSRFFS